MSGSQYQRRLIAILYADVAGYSRLTVTDEDGTHRQLSESLELFADRVVNAGGRIVHYAGDAVLASFDSVVSAVNCAIAIQRATAALRASRSEDSRLLFRIGVNVGEVIVDRDEIYGDDVNIAARLESLATPGGVCVSRGVLDHIAGKIDVRHEDLGDRELKNMPRPVRAYRILLDSDEPEARVAQNVLAKVSAYSSIAAAPGSGTVALDEAASQPPSIMVLPFRSLSGTRDSEALVHGFQVTIQSVLVRLPGLFLIAQAAPNAYGDMTCTAAQAGNEVGVRYVLEGSIQLEGEKVRVTAQLTDAPAAQVVWSERYDRSLRDIFELQDEITTAIVTALDAHAVRGSLVDLMWWRKISDWRLREPLLRGMSHLYRGTRDDNQLARELFEELVELVPDQGQAMALLALTHWFDVFRGWADSPRDSARDAAALAERAIALDEDPDGWAHLSLGYIRLFQNRHDEALDLSRHAAAVRASCPMAGGILADVLLFCGEPRSASAVVRKAVRTARVYPPWMANVLAASYRDMGEIASSISVLNEVLRLNTEDVDGLAILCTDLSFSNRITDARDAARRVLRIKPEFSIARYAESQPYRAADSLEKITDALREAQLPA